MKRAHFWILVVCISVALLGVICPRLFVSRQMVDAWLFPPSKGLIVTEGAVHPYFREVKGEGRAEAISLLGNTRSYRLSQIELSRMCDGEENHKGDPYLVRALMANPATGEFRVSYQDSLVFVQHGSLGRSSSPMVKRPLVVWLESAPKEVYTSVHIAE